jgi:hypothetical protein
MKNLILLALFVCLFASCEKSLLVEEPNWDIQLSNARSKNGNTLVFKLGDTCKYTVSGNADNIITYPGTAGFAYANINRTSATGEPSLQFTSFAQFGLQTNTLKLLASNSLTALDSSSVVNASWTDITSRAVLSTGTDNTASGKILLSDLYVAGKPLYIALKYNGVTGSTQKTWTFKNFAINNLLPDGSTINVSNLADISWTVYGNVRTPASGSWIASATQIQVVGGAATAPTNESWAISKPLDLTKVAPDVSIPIKNLTSAPLKTYTFQYTAIGKYKATFIASNTTLNDNKQVMKEFEIEIIP